MAQGHQPSHAIMRWATTAGIPTPAKMYNVAHGGKRRTRRKRHGKHSTKRHTKRSRKHRGGECGSCMAGIRP
jgi:putative hemolysin